MIMVGLCCSLEEAEKREKKRGRYVGLARNAHDSFTAQKTYDFTVDSDKHSPKECADLIKGYLENSPQPRAVMQLCAQSKNKSAKKK